MTRPPRFADAARRAAHLAATALGWRPTDFWAATPAELLTALGLDGETVARPADATLLKGLMERYPDEP
jgi:uncharacterized phage protein (TIGR02216 family)